MVPTTLPSIHLLIGPGTLTSQGRDRLDLLRYGPWHSGKERLTGQAVLAALPEAARFARLTVDPGNPYEMATPDDLRRLALYMGRLATRDDVDGIVFGQGTNGSKKPPTSSISPSHSAKPIVVTGAQRPFTALSTTGPLNSARRDPRGARMPGRTARACWSSPMARSTRARDVTKTSTYRLHTFRTRDLGVLGYVDADRVAFYREPLRRHTIDSEFDLAGIAAMPQVDILYVHAGARARLPKGGSRPPARAASASRHRRRLARTDRGCGYCARRRGHGGGARLARRRRAASFVMTIGKNQAW